MQQCDIVRFSVWYSGSRAYISKPYWPSFGNWIINVIIRSCSLYSYLTYLSRIFGIAVLGIVLLWIVEYWFELSLPWNLRIFGHWNLSIIGNWCVSNIDWKCVNGWILKWRIALAGPHSPDAHAGSGC